MICRNPRRRAERETHPHLSCTTMRETPAPCTGLGFRASTCCPIFRFSTKNTVSSFGWQPSYPLLSKSFAHLHRRFPLILNFGRLAVRMDIAFGRLGPLGRTRGSFPWRSQTRQDLPSSGSKRSPASRLLQATMSQNLSLGSSQPALPGLDHAGTVRARGCETETFGASRSGNSSHLSYEYLRYFSIPSNKPISITLNKWMFSGTKSVGTQSN